MTPGGWSGSSPSDIVVIGKGGSDYSEPSDVEEFDHLENDPESHLGEALPDPVVMDVQAMTQLANAIAGLQNVVQDPACGQDLTDALKGLKEEVGNKDKNKELNDKAEQADKDPSFCLE